MSTEEAYNAHYPFDIEKMNDTVSNENDSQRNQELVSNIETLVKKILELNHNNTSHVINLGNNICPVCKMYNLEELFSFLREILQPLKIELQETQRELLKLRSKLVLKSHKVKTLSDQLHQSKDYRSHGSENTDINITDTNKFSDLAIDNNIEYNTEKTLERSYIDYQGVEKTIKKNIADIEDAKLTPNKNFFEQYNVMHDFNIFKEDINELFQYYNNIFEQNLTFKKELESYKYKCLNNSRDKEKTPKKPSRTRKTRRQHSTYFDTTKALNYTTSYDFNNEQSNINYDKLLQTHTYKMNKIIHNKFKTGTELSTINNNLIDIKKDRKCSEKKILDKNQFLDTLDYRNKAPDTRCSYENEKLSRISDYSSKPYQHLSFQNASPMTSYVNTLEKPSLSTERCCGNHLHSHLHEHIQKKLNNKSSNFTDPRKKTPSHCENSKTKKHGYVTQFDVGVNNQCSISNKGNDRKKSSIRKKYEKEFTHMENRIKKRILEKRENTLEK